MLICGSLKEFLEMSLLKVKVDYKFFFLNSFIEV